MKISGPSRVGSTSVGKTRRSGDSGKSFDVSAPAAETAVNSLSASHSLTAVDALLAVQETRDATQGRARAVQRAEDILDVLDEIRMGLLNGVIPKEKLNQLVRAVGKRRDMVADPRLQHVLDEIELRAAVELAKLDNLLQRSD